jgi:flagellar basal body-associated protein FliL
MGAYMQRILGFLFLLAFIAAPVAVLAVDKPAAEEKETPGKPESPEAQAPPQTKDKSAKKEGEGDDKKKKGPENVSGGRFAGDPIYVHMDPMILPVISDQGVEQLVTIVIDIEVKDFDAADDMHTKMPKVRDALMRALYGGLGKGNLRNGKLVDVNKVKVKAAAALREVMGDGIRDVLIQGVSQRML